MSKQKQNPSAAIALITSLLLPTVPDAFAGKKPEKKPAPPASSKSRPSATQVLWDHWYTISNSDGSPFAIYNERVEVRDRGVFVKTETKIREAGFVNAENLGAFAKDSNELAPLFFNFVRIQRATEEKIDGTLVPGTRKIQYNVRIGDQAPRVAPRKLPEGAIFSAHLPLWLGRQLSRSPSRKSGEFAVLFEDKLDVEVVTGKYEVLPPDDFAKMSDSLRLRLTYAEEKSEWWIEKSGAAVKQIYPATGRTVIRANSKSAEKFLEGE